MYSLYLWLQLLMTGSMGLTTDTQPDPSCGTLNAAVGNIALGSLGSDKSDPADAPIREVADNDRLADYFFGGAQEWGGVQAIVVDTCHLWVARVQVARMDSPVAVFIVRASEHTSASFEPESGTDLSVWSNCADLPP